MYFFQIGPGIVYLVFDSMFGRGVFVQSITPVEPLVQKLVHNVYLDWKLPKILAKFFMYGEAIQALAGYPIHFCFVLNKICLHRFTVPAHLI